jgi:hypothetical protein
MVLIIIAVILFFVVIHHIDKNNMIKEQVDKQGGMVKKYNTLLNGLNSLPNSSLIKVSRSEIHLNSTISHILFQFEIIETFDRVVIYLNVSIKGYPKQRKEWSYAPVYPQEKILEDIETYLKWLLNENMNISISQKAHF